VDKSLLDTDIFSEVLKGVDPQVVARATAYRAAFGYYTISAITVLEVVKGFQEIQEKGSSLLLAQLASFISLKTTNTKPWLSNPVRAKMRDR